MEVTLLRDSKGRFGFAVGVEAAGVVITKIAPSDALPLAGMFDERDRMRVGDIVLSVGAMPLVNERGLPVSGMDLESVRSLIKDAQGDSITLTLQRPAAAPCAQPKPAAVAGPAGMATDADDEEKVVLIRDAHGRFGLNVDQDERGIFIKQLAAGPTVGDGRSRLQLGLYLSSIARVGTHGLSREHARAIIKGVEGNCLELGVRRPPPHHLAHRPPPSGAARGGTPALWPPQPQQPQQPPHGWVECADGGYVREDGQAAPPTWHDGGRGGRGPVDPFLAFAMAGTDVPPARPGRQDLPPRVHARTPPC